MKVKEEKIEGTSAPRNQGKISARYPLCWLVAAGSQSSGLYCLLLDS